MNGINSIFIIFLFILTFFLSCTTAGKLSEDTSGGKKPRQQEIEPVKESEKEGKDGESQVSEIDLLFKGIAFTNIEIVKKALKDGADVNFFHNTNGSPLLFAVSLYKSHLNMSKLGEINWELDLLKDLNLNITKEDITESIQLMKKFFSIDEKSADRILTIIEILIKSGADVNFKFKNSASPFFRICAYSDDEDVVSLFLNHGADLNEVVSGGLTPLIAAINSVNVNTTELLLKRGADPNFADEKKHSPLHYAVWPGRMDLVRVLIKYGADVNFMSLRGGTPLGNAIFYNFHQKSIQQSALKGLIENSKGTNAIIMQLEVYSRWGKNYWEIVEFFLERGADINLKKEGKDSAFYFVLNFKQREKARYFVNKGADIAYEEARVKKLIEKGETEYYHPLAVIYFITDREKLIENEIGEACDNGVEKACMTMIFYYYVDYMENLEYANLLLYYQKLLKINPENMRYLSGAGFYLIFDKKLDLAKKYIIRTIENGAEWSNNYMNLGHILLLEGDVEGAWENYDRYLTQNEKSEETMIKGFEEDLKVLVKYYPEKRDILKKTIGEVIEKIRSAN